MGGMVEALAVKLTGDTSDFDSKIGAADSKWEGFTSKLDGAGAKMKSVGGKMTAGITAPLLGIGTAAVMTVAGFDDSMSKVQAISGATGEDLGRLRDLAKELGSQTAFSASQAADAMSYLALAGWDTNQILEATPQMLSLASAGAMDLATAADIVSDTMSAFQMDASRAGEAADIFAVISSKSNTDILQLGEGMKYAAANSNAFGMDLGQTAVILGIFADQGVKGSMGGTTFNAMLRDLKKSAIDGTIAIGDNAVAIVDAGGNYRDLESIMADVGKAADGMTQAQRDAALSSIFQEQAMRGANMMLAAGTERADELSQAVDNASGTSRRMAEVMQDNVGGGFRELRSQTEGILIQLGEQLAPLIRDPIIPLLQEFGNRISAVIDWFSGLDSNTQKWILTAIGVVAAMGPMLVIMGTVATAISALIPVVGAIGGALSLLLGPVGLIVLAVGALALAWTNDFMGIQTKTKEVFGYLTDAWPGWMGTLKQGWQTFTDWWNSDTDTKISGVRSALQGWADGERQRMDTLSNNLRTGWQTFTDWWASNTRSAADTVRNAWDTHGGEVRSIAENQWGTLQGIYRTNMDAVQGILQAGMQFMRGDWQGGLDTLRTTADNVMGNLQGVFRSQMDNIAAVFRMFGWEMTGEDIVRGIQRGIERGIQWVNDAARRVANSALDAMKSALGISSPSKAAEDEVGAEIPPGTARGVVKAMPTANRTISAALGDMLDGIPSLADSMPMQAVAAGPSLPAIHVYIDGPATYEGGRAAGRGIVDELRARGLQ